ncbi:hypothetical protein AGMMS49546_31520 [Spirochaetia bacterium]|nr:hypothetical protein AGMMS49546_31520 [Spirochaetia bacterium]
MKTSLIAGMILACVLALPGCATGSRAAALKAPAQAQAKPFESFQIQDYETKGEGASIPEWVRRYLTEGVRGVERIPEFRDKYVFVGVNAGPNFKALRQWEEAFSPAQDFARLVAARIEARLSPVTQTTVPDSTYGQFFAALIKRASDAQYQGAVKENGFWIQQLFSTSEQNEEGEESEEIVVNREVYDFLILTSIDKVQLETQISAMFNAAKISLAPKRNQAAAIDRIRENFFEGF